MPCSCAATPPSPPVWWRGRRHSLIVTVMVGDALVGQALNPVRDYRAQSQGPYSDIGRRNRQHIRLNQRDVRHVRLRVRHGLRPMYTYVYHRLRRHSLTLNHLREHQLSPSPVMGGLGLLHYAEDDDAGGRKNRKNHNPNYLELHFNHNYNLSNELTPLNKKNHRFRNNKTSLIN